jgi:hypothetical protein
MYRSWKLSKESKVDTNVEENAFMTWLREFLWKII